MMPITHNELGVDEDLGRRIIRRARIIAPCLATIDVNSEDGKDAIAILKGVIAELPAIGSRRTRSVSRNGTSMSFETAIASAFDGDATDSLRALCGAIPSQALPMGSFPKEAAFGRVWPEGEYS